MIYKRGKVYWFSFGFNNKRIQKSTKQGNPRVARQIEAAYRTKLSKGEVGIHERKPAPLVADFAKSFLSTMRNWHKEKPNTVEYYETGVRRLLDFEPLAKSRLDQVDEALIAKYIQQRQSDKKPNGNLFRRPPLIGTLRFYGGCFVWLPNGEKSPVCLNSQASR